MSLDPIMAPYTILASEFHSLSVPLHTPPGIGGQGHDDIYILGTLSPTVLKICSILFPSGCVTYINDHNPLWGKPG